MKVGLLDIDGHNYPNLALMKLSAWHKKKGDQVEFVNHFFDYDRVYKSKVFTFTPDNTTSIDSETIISGGTGYDLKSELWESVEHTHPDYSLYNYPHALGFLTRGCIRNCSFCVVPQKEGKMKSNADITEFWNGQKVAVLMDNNVLASIHGLRQIEKIINLGIKVDFNQGLDARIIAKNSTIAQLLSKVKWHKPIRLACDRISQLSDVRKAIELLRKYGATPKRYFVYVLVQNIEDAHYIVNELKTIEVDPFAQPLITETTKPTYEQKAFARWVNIRYLNNIAWEDYKYNPKFNPQQ